MVPEWAQETGQGLPEWAQEPGDVELAVQPTAAAAAAASTQAKFHEQEQPAERGGDATLPSWYFDDDKEEGKSGWDGPPQSDKIVTTDAPGRPPDLEDPEHRALVVGLVRGRVVWRDGDSCIDCIKDWWFFACQTHPLLDVLFAHPFHPFRRTVRRLHLLSMTFVTFFVAAISELNYNTEPLNSPNRIKFIALSNVTLVVYDFILRELGTCTCFAAGGCCESCCVMCGCLGCCISLGDSILFGFVIISGLLFLVSLGFLLARHHFSSSFVMLFIFMKLLAWGSFFLISIIWYLWERRQQRKSWKDGKPSGPYPYPRLPSVEYFAASWTFCGWRWIFGEPTLHRKKLVGSVDTDMEEAQVRQSERRRPDTANVDAESSNPLHSNDDGDDSAKDNADGTQGDQSWETEELDDPPDDTPPSSTSRGLLSYFNRPAPAAAQSNSNASGELDFSAAMSVVNGKPMRASSASSKAATAGVVAPSRFSSPELASFYSSSSSSASRPAAGSRLAARLNRG